MYESRGSWNAYYKSATGNKEQFTLRQEDAQSDADFILRVKQFDKTLATQGWKPFAGSEQSNGTNGSGESPSRVRKGEKSIEVQSISLAAGGEHPRWVIKGGKLTKFGVTCWPETLETAGLLGNEDAKKNLDPLKDNKPKKNWIAWYTERENDEGKIVPDKVTRLERKN